MMEFYMVKEEELLTTPISLGGCGLTQAQVNGIKPVQKKMGYRFHYHKGQHGNGAHNYIYIVGKKVPRGNVLRMFIDDQEIAGGSSGITQEHVNDARKVVAGNQALFYEILDNLRQ
jgi:hypothetical protein